MSEEINLNSLSKSEIAYIKKNYFAPIGDWISEDELIAYRVYVRRVRNIYQKSCDLQKDCDLYIGLGVILYQNNLYEYSDKAFKRALSGKKNLWQLYLLIGYCFSSHPLKLYKAAIIYFEKSINLHKNKASYIGLGNSLFKIGEYKSGLSALKKSLDNNDFYTYHDYYQQCVMEWRNDPFNKVSNNLFKEGIVTYFPNNPEIKKLSLEIRDIVNMQNLESSQAPVSFFKGVMSLQQPRTLMDIIVNYSQENIFSSYIAVSDASIVKHIPNQIGKENNKSSFLWHYDYAAYGQLKAMVLLTDVKEGDGEFEWINSTLSNKPIYIESRFSPELPINPIIHRLPEEAINRSISNGKLDLKKFTGKAGDVLLFDPNIAHRATRCFSPNPRLILAFTMRPVKNKKDRYNETREYDTTNNVKHYSIT